MNDLNSRKLKRGGRVAGCQFAYAFGVQSVDFALRGRKGEGVVVVVVTCRLSKKRFQKLGHKQVYKSVRSRSRFAIFCRDSLVFAVESYIHQ
jgi:hypothetical protein